MPGQIITIAQQKGGSGKTTLCANLAIALQRKGKRVAILDTDPQGSLGQWYMLRREAVGDRGPQLGFATASAWGARYEARELAKDHDFVLIDTPPKMGVDGRPAIEVADLVIIPVSASPLDVWATQPTAALAEAEKKPVLVVMNRISSRTRITGEIAAALKKLNFVCARSRLGNRVGYAEMVGTGQSVVEKRASDPASIEMMALAKEVLKKLGG